MKISGVRVSVTKTVSDGRYGNERFAANPEKWLRA